MATFGGGERTFKAKAPYTGTGLKDATRDEVVILAWWKRWPDALIGVPMGVNGAFAIDFDPRVEEDCDPETGEVVARREWTLEQLKAELEAQIGEQLPTTLTSITQSGGVHVWFKQPGEGDPIRNRGNLPQHVDVRGHGGYVIAAPSITRGPDGVELGRYRWIRGDWRDDAAIVDAPAALIAVLRDRGRRAPVERTPMQSSSRAAASPDVDDAVRKYALAALDGECRDIRSARSGRRNAQLNESAFKIATLVAAGAIDATIARSSIEAAARDNAGRDDDRQLAATIDSGWTAGLDQPRDLEEIAASARSRRERGPPGRGARLSSPRPGSDDDGKPSSHEGGLVSNAGREGGEGRREADLTRECAFLPHTDLGNLERFLKRYGRDFLFVEQWGWLAWDGRRWNRDMAVALLGRAVQKTVRAIQEEAQLIAESGVPEAPLELLDAEAKREHEARQRSKYDRVVSTKRGEITLFSDTIAKWGRTSESAGHISCIPKLAEARLTARTDDFDTDPLLLNVQNGTLLFVRPTEQAAAHVELRRPRRRDRITKLAAVDYVADAGSEKFDVFLAEVQPEAEMRTFLDVWAGYNALGLADAQKMALFYGEGSNGKGVWVTTIASLLGDYAWSAAIETFIDQGKYRKGSDASPDLAALAGRRMVYANEPEENSKFSDGLIKSLTSDEPIGGVRELLKPPFQLLVTFTNTIMANNRPKIGTDHGIQRRMQVVPWDVIIPAERQDLQLKAKLKAEAPGILNRIIRGALQYLTSGIPVPDAVKEATEAYKAENDILGQFIGLCIERVEGETMGATALHELFAAWQTWAQLLPASGKPWSPKYLASQMEKKRFHKRKSSSMVWDDIAPLYEARDFTDNDGRPVTGELPPPRRTRALPPAPDSDRDDDMIPL